MTWQSQLLYNILVFSADLLTPPSHYAPRYVRPALPLKGAELGSLYVDYAHIDIYNFSRLKNGIKYM